MSHVPDFVGAPHIQGGAKKLDLSHLGLAFNIALTEL